MTSPSNRKYVAAGTYGCVYTPSLKCSDGIGGQDDQVSKLFVKNEPEYNLEDYYSELEHNRSVKELNAQGNFTAKEIGNCLIAPMTLENDDKNSCVMSYNMGEAPGVTEKHRNMIRNNMNNINIPQIIYEKSGNPITSAVLTESHFKNFLSSFHNILEGLVTMNRQGKAHNDIKPDNVLYNSSTNKTVLIDFGMMAKEDVIYNVVNSPTGGITLEKLHLIRHIYMFYPPEFKVVAAFIDAKLNNIKTPSHANELDDLYTTYIQNDRILNGAEKKIYDSSQTYAPRYRQVLSRFTQQYRSNRIFEFIMQIKDNLGFKSFNTVSQFLDMIKFFKIRRFGSLVDIYSIGVSLFMLVKKYAISKLSQANVNVNDESHNILIITLLDIISGMVHPNPMKRLNAQTSLNLYQMFINADTVSDTQKMRTVSDRINTIILNNVYDNENVTNDTIENDAKGRFQNFMKRLNKTTHTAGPSNARPQSRNNGAGPSNIRVAPPQSPNNAAGPSNARPQSRNSRAGPSNIRSQSRNSRAGPNNARPQSRNSSAGPSNIRSQSRNSRAGPSNIQVAPPQFPNNGAGPSNIRSQSRNSRAGPNNIQVAPPQILNNGPGPMDINTIGVPGSHNSKLSSMDINRIGVPGSPMNTSSG